MADFNPESPKAMRRAPLCPLGLPMLRRIEIFLDDVYRERSVKDMKFTMIWRLALVILSVGILCGSIRGKTAPQPSVALTISADQDSVKAGAPVRVKAFLENKTNHDIPMALDASGGKAFPLEVRDAQGNLAPETPLGYVWNGNQTNLDADRVSPKELSGNLVFGSLKAGDRAKREMDVSKFYEMKQPGKYTIQARALDPENSSITVKSNTITITVTP
jgi:hypothetical protein